MSETKYTCAVCGTPMKVEGKCEVCALEEFHPKYFHAFMALVAGMLHNATGQTEVHISKELLDKFPIEEAPKWKWDPTTDNWILELVEKPPVIIEVGKKIMKPRRRV